MGFSYQSSLQIPIFLIAHVFLFFLKLKSKFSPSHQKLPPGPMKLPFIGNLHNLIGSLPHQTLRDLSRRYGPLMHLKMGRASTLIISSPDMAREFTRTLDRSSAPTRKLCMVELLNDERVRSLSRVREEEVQNLIEKIRWSWTMIDHSKRLQESMSAIMSRAAFGSDWERNSSALRSGIMGEGSDEVLQSIITKHVSKAFGGEDLVDALLRIQKIDDFDVPLTTNDVKDVIRAILNGGTENAAKIVEWAMAEMMKNPTVMQKAQAEIRQLLKGKTTINEADIREMKYLHMVIKETLRLHPPIPLLPPRECRLQCTIAGYDIPAKTSVIINAWAIGRNPEHWGSDSESFKPERFVESSGDYKGTNFECMPFGVGTSICPGISFGSANVELVLSQLLYRFDWNLPVGMEPENLDMTELFGASIGRKHNLVLSAVPFSA